jgi:hypothetical protein
VRSLEDVAASSGLAATVWSCSAGYGLIGLDSRIKPYSTTFASNHSDTVRKWRDVDTGGTSSSSWWDLQTMWPSSDPYRSRLMAAITAAYPASSLLIIASHTYLRAMAEDIRRAAGTLCDSALICIISSGTKHLLGLDTHLLPSTAALQAEQGGSLRSLNIRLGRNILSESGGEPPHLPPLRAFFAERVATAPPVVRPQRERMTDEQVQTYIMNSLGQDSSLSWTAPLRRLRPWGLACRQERFAFLFWSIKTRIAQSQSGVGE